MKRILITNDDGIMAEGIIRLAKAAKAYGEVWVIAPESQRSAASHSITLRGCIDCYPQEFPVEGVHAYAITGTPADCVRVGIRNVMKERPDLVLSGINFGYNSGTDLQYSATAGAAFEAVFQGIPAIAFSEGVETDKRIADTYTETIIGELMDAPLCFGEIWNVNYPSVAVNEVKGILRDRTVSHHSLFDDEYTEELQEDGRIRFRVNGLELDYAEEGSDLRALLDGYISIGKVKNIGN